MDFSNIYSYQSSLIGGEHWKSVSLYSSDWTGSIRNNKWGPGVDWNTEIFSTLRWPPKESKHPREFAFSTWQMISEFSFSNVLSNSVLFISNTHQEQCNRAWDDPKNRWRWYWFMKNFRYYCGVYRWSFQQCYNGWLYISLLGK